MNETSPFWKRKPLAAMSKAEWESLCDGCGKCCLHKLQDEDTGALEHTNVACRLLDLDTARCKDYGQRRRHVPDCVKITANTVSMLPWLPSTCAYRLLAEGRELPWWHPLVSGNPDTVHRAGMSVRHRSVSETDAGPIEHHMVDWDDL